MIVREPENMSPVKSEGTGNNFSEKRLGVKRKGAMVTP